MFKLEITLRSADEARAALSGLRTQIDKSGLSAQSSEFLFEQLETTLRNLVQQMSIEHLRNLKVDRVLEGDGYRVSVKVRQSGPGAKSWLGRLFGGS